MLMEVTPWTGGNFIMMHGRSHRWLQQVIGASMVDAQGEASNSA